MVVFVVGGDCVGVYFWVEFYYCYEVVVVGVVVVFCVWLVVCVE